jgi:hypothetical protein
MNLFRRALKDSLRWTTLLAVAWACGACSDDDVSLPDELGPAVNTGDLFSLDHLPRFNIYLDEAAYAALEAEPKEWVHGSFEYNGFVIEDVGVRLKGNHSFRPLGEKSSFKVKFNKFVKGTRFLGLEGLTFNNMVVDSSMLREWISYRVMDEIGVPAARAGFSQIYLNDKEYGLYLTLEPYDDEFLERVFDDPSGNLYEAENGADINTSVDPWDQDEGEDESRDDLLAFSLLAQEEGSAVFFGDQAMVDMPKFLAFLAGESIVGHFDGHIGGHNFYIYHEPTEDLWSYQPSGMDQCLARHVTPYEHEGFLGYKCLHEEDCLVEYVLAHQEALDKLDQIDFLAEVSKAVALTDAAMRSDPLKPYSIESVENGRTRSLEYITERVAELEPQLDCLVDGEQPDADNDGFGPCFQDCDESDPDIHPNAGEPCDGVDNDCSGYVDDIPACECPSVVSEGQTFYLCHNSITWNEAEDYCEAQDKVLAHFKSEAQSAEVWAQAEAIDPGRWAIGLNDRVDENTYLWLDGSAPTFEIWGNGQPAHALDWFDCVQMLNGVWIESNCIEKGSFMCTEP